MQNTQSAFDELPPHDARQVGRGDWTRFGLFVCAILGLIALVVSGIALFGDRLPTLTEEKLRAAVRRWNESGVRSYTMDLEISGPRAGNVHVEVENGVVIELTRDGQTPRRRATWDVWSVPGQFDMMQEGLRMAADPVGEMQAEEGAQVVVRARFDPDLGYPLAFSQVTLGGGTDFGWKTARFERR